MKKITSLPKILSLTPSARRQLLAALALAILAWVPSRAGAEPDRADGPDRDRAGRYEQTNLVSDQPGVALLQDTNLVNAWGMSFTTTSPFWISDNGAGVSTLYMVSYTNDLVQVTKVALTVSIPGEGVPTGQVANNTGAFNGDLFIFAGEDGVISGWRPALGGAAEILASRATGVYKGITLATNASGPILLAANFREATIDAYDQSLSLTQWSDPNTPPGYAPFNVQSLAGMVFVTFAKQDDQKHDDVAGRGHGLIDVLDPMTGTFHRFATGKDAGGKLQAIDSPWGLAVAPAGFGLHADQLLVGNFGSGTIMAFEADGTFKGLLRGRHGPIHIDGLWGLAFGNGAKAGRPQTLYFTAGPQDESHGLFGSLDPIFDGDGD